MGFGVVGEEAWDQAWCPTRASRSLLGPAKLGPAQLGAPWAALSWPGLAGAALG